MPFNAWVWNPYSREYVPVKGKPVDTNGVRKIVNGIRGNVTERIRTLAQRVKDGKETNLTQFSLDFKDEIRNLYITTHVLARGGIDEMEPSDWGMLGRSLRDQYDFVGNLVRDLENVRVGVRGDDGEIIVRDSGIPELSDGFLDRVEMYTESSWGAAGEFENVLRDRESGFGSLERRVLDPMAEHCDDCMAQAELEWQPPGVLEDIGDTACGPGCRCFFEFENEDLQSAAESFGGGPGNPDEDAEKSLPERYLKSLHKFASTQLNMPPEWASQVLQLAGEIPDDVLDPEEGRETTPHITVMFGFNDQDPAPVQALLADEPPIELTIGKTSVFTSGQTDQGYDVVKIDIESKDLRRIHEKIAANLDVTETHSYRPHMTLAYVKPGKGKKFVGSNALTGHKLTFSTIIFSDKDKNTTEITLTGSKKSISERVDALDPDLLAIVDDRIRLFEEAFPKPASLMAGVALLSAGDRNTLAWVELLDDGYWLFLNAPLWKDKNELQDVLTEAHRFDYVSTQPVDTIEATLDHELGHILDDWILLNQKKGETLGSNNEVWLSEDAQNISRYAKDTKENQAGEAFAEAFAIHQIFGENKIPSEILREALCQAIEFASKREFSENSVN